MQKAPLIHKTSGATNMPAPKIISELVDRFERQIDVFKSGRYNETQLRREFLDPLFTALGWDMDNKSGYAEAYKDVIHEDAIKVGDATKAPDYCFRVGGARKFFLEAKKPSIDIKADAHPAFQLRRYAWTTKLPLSVLSDFEEFAVYDCRIKPDKTDTAATARVIYLTFRDYVEKWEEIAKIFSRDAVLKGSFDNFAESNKSKRGTADVDEAFLETIETWRKELAQNLALRNQSLSQRELNFAVQRIIDRVIFLRICEGRGIEDYGRLQALVNGDRIYPRLCQLFEAADLRYNSGLFHFKPERNRHEQPDELTLGLQVDDKLLRDILKDLYYPESPYVFSALPADILGQVYEQFLGKIIRLTDAHQAKIDPKPEVKKAGGVFYTPAFIVRYIVRSSVGALLKSKTPRQAANLRLLDPACGSGSFLIEAYQFLLDWHLEYYQKDNPEKWARGARPVLARAAGGLWKLAIAERKRILLNNIFGVDIDAQAVEVTKLSLLLKVLEGETGQDLQTIFRHFQERALPDLGHNIKCGNSLIAPDFYRAGQMSLFTDEDRYRVNVFDWAAEFPEVFEGPPPAGVMRESAAAPMDFDAPGAPLHGVYATRKPRIQAGSKAPFEPDWRGGFDAVIGNPPFVLLQDEFRDDRQLDYFRSKFVAASFKIDTYHLFIEQSINLAKPGGFVSLITPANFLANNHLDKLRRLMLERTSIERIVVIDGGVFSGVSVDNAIFLLTVGGAGKKPFEMVRAKIEGSELRETSMSRISPRAALADRYVLFTGSMDSTLGRVLEKIAGSSAPLESFAEVNFGKQLRDRKQHVTDVITVSSERAIPKGYVACYNGRDVERYFLKWSGMACLDDTEARRGGCWDRSKHEAKRKLLTRQIGRFPQFAIDEAGRHCLNTIFMVNPKQGGINPCFLLGVLNSKLTQALWLLRFYDRRRTFPKIKGSYLKQLPVPNADPSEPDCQLLVSLVEQIQEIQLARNAAKTPQERTSLERQSEMLENKINALVYKLFGLAPDDIAALEKACQSTAPVGCSNDQTTQQKMAAVEQR